MNKNKKLGKILVFALVGLGAFWAFTFLIAIPEEIEINRLEAEMVSFNWANKTIVNEINCNDVNGLMLRLAVDRDVTEENKEIITHGMKIFRDKCHEEGYWQFT